MNVQSPMMLIAMVPWNSQITVYPLADKFPMMPFPELQDLAADIKANGLKEPVDIFTTEDSKEQLLDGRNRLEALQMLGREVLDVDGKVLAEYRGTVFTDPAKATAHVISMNVMRRHLKPKQKQAAIEEALKANPAISNRQIAEVAKVDHKTVAKARADLERTGEIPQLKQTVGADGKSRPVKAKPMKAKPVAGVQGSEMIRPGLIEQLTELLLDDDLGKELKALAKSLPESQEHMTPTEIEAHDKMMGAMLKISKRLGRHYEKLWRAEKLYDHAPKTKTEVLSQKAMDDNGWFNRALMAARYAEAFGTYDDITKAPKSKIVLKAGKAATKAWADLVAAIEANPAPWDTKLDRRFEEEEEGRREQARQTYGEDLE